MFIRMSPLCEVLVNRLPQFARSQALAAFLFRNPLYKLGCYSLINRSFSKTDKGVGIAKIVESVLLGSR